MIEISASGMVTLPCWMLSFYAVVVMFGLVLAPWRVTDQFDRDFEIILATIMSAVVLAAPYLYRTIFL